MFYSGIDKNKRKGEMEHKLNLAAKFSLIKILNEKRPILPVPKDREQLIPNLFAKMIWNPFGASLKNPVVSEEATEGLEEEDDKDEDEVDYVENHHASNLPVVIGALVFLNARLQRMANFAQPDDSGMHRIGIQWQRVHENTKRFGEWTATEVHQKNKILEEGKSMADIFGPRVYVVRDDSEEAKIKKLYADWKQSDLAGKDKRTLYDAYSAAIDSCSLSLSDFIDYLLYRPAC